MPKRIPGKHFARNLIERRTLIYQLVKRDFQQRYVGSTAGWLWGVINPLVILGIYSIVFGRLLKSTPGPGEVTQNYPLWLFSGMLPWLLFNETVQRSSGSIVEQSNLVTRTMFPSEIVPVSIFLSSLVSHLLALALFLVIVGVAQWHLSATILLLPVCMLLVGLLAVGIGWIAAALQVYLRDTAQVVAVVLNVWFWVTPIMISERKWNDFPKNARYLLAANPLVYVVRAYRDMLLGNSPALREVGIAATFAIVAFVGGGLFFRHMKRGFADVL